MRARIAIILGFALLVTAAHGQTDNLIHVKAFNGSTIGAMLTEAMVTCPNAPQPCILVLDASLAGKADGTMPSLCSNCSLWDFRDGVPSSGSSGPPEAVLVTDPPYNAACDGSTDDTAAIQAAFNSGAAIVYLPQSTATMQYQCNISSTLTTPALSGSGYFDFEMQGAILGDTNADTSAAIDTSASVGAIIEGGTIQFEAAGNGPGINAGTGFTYVRNMLILDGDDDYDAIKVNGWLDVQNVSTDGILADLGGEIYVSGYTGANDGSYAWGAAIEIENSQATLQNVELYGTSSYGIAVSNGPNNNPSYLHLANVYYNGGGTALYIQSAATLQAWGNLSLGYPGTAYLGNFQGSLSVFNLQNNTSTTYTNAITVLGAPSGSYVKADGTGYGTPGGGGTVGILQRWSGNSCTLGDDGTGGSSCQGNVVWSPALTGTPHTWCQVYYDAAASCTNQGDCASITINTLTDNDAAYNYYIDTRVDTSRGHTIPMTCWASN